MRLNNDHKKILSSMGLITTFMSLAKRYNVKQKYYYTELEDSERVSINRDLYKYALLRELAMSVRTGRVYNYELCVLEYRRLRSLRDEFLCDTAKDRTCVIYQIVLEACAEAAEIYNQQLKWEQVNKCVELCSEIFQGTLSRFLLSQLEPE